MKPITPAVLIDVLDNVLKRLSGPAHLRFIIQPLIGVFLGIRDGILDAKAGEPPYLYRIIFDSAMRRESFKGGLKAISMPFIIATILDAVIQFYLLESVSLIGALLVGGLLVGLPYAAARGLTNRIVRHRYETQQENKRSVIRQNHRAPQRSGRTIEKKEL